MSKPVILTGLRANNDLHIGNYFGGLLPIINMAKNQSEKYQINLFVPDLHSFTTPIDHASLQQQIMHNLQLFVAAGLPLDNPDVHIYRQSYISAHSELTWILDCFTGFGEMSRMTQFKDKSTVSDTDRTSVGLFNYPVLMAADILLYNASYIPVGDDQSQHIEFTRDIAKRLNNRFEKELFTIPKSVTEQHSFFGKEQGLRIRDLLDPSKKMSKSDETGKGVIFLSDTPEVAHKKILGATTDSYGEVQYDPLERPGISNLLEILALLTEQSIVQVKTTYEGETSYGSFKTIVADAVVSFLTKFQEDLQKTSIEKIEDKLVSSEATLTIVANKSLLGVQKAVGLR